MWRTGDFGAAEGRVERCELDRVSVYFAEIEVGAHGCDVVLGNVVGCAPDARAGLVLGRGVSDYDISGRKREGRLSWLG